MDSDQPPATGRYPGLRPESRLLMCVASPIEEARRLADVSDLVRHSLDWEYLLGCAAQNEMLPLLYWHLNAACPDRVPAAVLRRLSEFFFQTSIRNLALLKELTQLLRLLRERGIDAVPFKGPLLARALYGNVAFRRTLDLDILVRPESIEPTRELLLQEGYKLTPALTEVQIAAHRDSHYHFEFKRTADDLRVEIHWEFLPKNCGRFDTAYVWDHLVTDDLGGQPTLSLRAEELLVLLCIHHGSKHEWDRLKWVADIGRIIQAHPRLDWTAVTERARALDQERTVLLGCFLAAYLLEVELPPEILFLVKNETSLAPRAALIRGRLFRVNRGLPGYREWCAYIDALSGPFLPEQGVMRYPRNLQYLLAVMTPEFGDRYNLRLPGRFSFIHYLSRPVRLLSRHGTDLFRRLN